VHGKKLVEKSTPQQNVLRYLIVSHGLAKLKDFLHDKFSYFAYGFYFQLVECVVYVIEAFYFLWRFFV